MRRQLKRMGAMFDWEHEAISADPKYYKWNQWFFLKMYERGLAYRKNAPTNWCPKDQTVLANEQVVNGVCERCGTAVIQKDLEQWFFKIRDYADELLEYKGADWPTPSSQCSVTGSAARRASRSTSVWTSPASTRR